MIYRGRLESSCPKLCQFLLFLNLFEHYAPRNGYIQVSHILTNFNKLRPKKLKIAKNAEKSRFFWIYMTYILFKIWATYFNVCRNVVYA